MDTDNLVSLARNIRRAILLSTSQAGSGHPTSALSAVELMTVLFFDEFFKQNHDRFILSKGHAAPLLYSLYYAAGLIPEKELLTLRQFGSRLEGHPTPRFPYANIATGSLGQGVSVGLGMALATRLSAVSSNQLESVHLESDFNQLPTTDHCPRIFVLLGDSEMAEGQVWEAMQLASYYKTNNLIAIVDVNRLGQRGETMLGWDLETYKKRAEAFGWEAHTIEDGHNIQEIQKTFKSVISFNQLESDFNREPIPTDSKPVMIFAKTVKGKGVSFLENKNGWHGKTLSPEELEKAFQEIGSGEESVGISGRLQSVTQKLVSFQADSNQVQLGSNRQLISTDYNLNDMVSTRKAYGQALLEIGHENHQIVALDGEVSNSTYVELFGKEFPERFFEMFIAEQNMVSTAVGLSVFGFIPFVSTFVAFLTRTFDQIRMASYSQANIKLVGSHAGVSIGQDGPSQMGLEDIAMMRSIQNSTVLYPSDAVSTRKLVKEISMHKGIDYLRTTRMETPVIYSENEEFPIGGLKIIRQSDKDVAVVIGAGITVHEALKAYEELKKKDIFITVVDLYSVKPLDVKALTSLLDTSEVSGVIVVEDHYVEGGIGEAVASALSRLPTTGNRPLTSLSVRKIPRSGKPEELLQYEEIDSISICKSVYDMTA